MESQLAAKRRQRAAAPRAEAPAGAQHFVPPWHGQAAPAPQWMHGGGGGMPHAFGADPVAAAARSTALAAVASGFQHAGGDRNAALGLAAASLLWTDVAHMQAATVAARAMAAGAAGQDGAGANPFASRRRRPVERAFPLTRSAWAARAGAWTRSRWRRRRPWPRQSAPPQSPAGRCEAARTPTRARSCTARSASRAHTVRAPPATPLARAAQQAASARARCISPPRKRMPRRLVMACSVR